MTRLSLRELADILARSGAQPTNPRDRVKPMRLSILLLALCLAGACTSSSGSRPSSSDPAAAQAREPVRMTVADYRSSAVFELVNEAHTSAIDQYSKVATDAARKVQEDELMLALRDYLEQEGLSKLAQPGKAPTFAKGTKAWTLEVDDARGLRHLVATPSTPPEDMKKMRGLLEAVLATYNETQGWQAVDIRAKHGEDYFNQQRPAVKNP